MKRMVAIAIVALFAVGCHKSSVAKPTSGTAVLELAVFAEPKEGAPAVDAKAYVAAVEQPVDYASLDHIVVWLEPVAQVADRSSIASISFDVGADKGGSELNGAVTVGQPIVLQNRGAAAVKIFSVSDGNDFDLGEIAASGSASFNVAAVGLIEVLSSGNRDPVLRLFAVPSQWVRTAKSGEVVEFRDLPPGRYKIVSWHPRLPGHDVMIDLPADQVVDAEVKVGVNGLPQISHE